MAKLATFNLPELNKKQPEVEYHFTIELRKLISSTGCKMFLLNTIISIGEN